MRFQAFLRGEWATLLQGETPPRSADRPQQTATRDQQASKAIAALASGNLTKAMTQLVTLGVEPQTDATAATVKSMLCPRNDPLPVAFEYLRGREGMRQLTAREVATQLRQAGRGKAKDALGWAQEHLCAVLGDKDLTQRLTTVFNLMLQGTLTNATQEALARQPVTPRTREPREHFAPLAVQPPSAASPTGH